MFFISKSLKLKLVSMNNSLENLRKDNEYLMSEIIKFKNPPLHKIGDEIKLVSKEGIFFVCENPILHSPFGKPAGWRYVLIDKETGNKTNIINSFEEEDIIKNATPKK